MRKWTAIAIAFCFGLYASARLMGGGLMLMQIMGLSDSVLVKSAIQKVEEALPVMNETAFIPFSVPMYFAFSVLLGLVLIAGALGVAFRQWWGIWPIFLYYLLFGLSFLNFQIVNEKLIHLFIGLGVAIVLFFLTIPDRRKLITSEPA